MDGDERANATKRGHYFNGMSCNMNTFVSSFVYYGLIFNASTLPVDVYVNICLAAILEFLGSVFILLVLSRVGRKKPAMLTYALSGLCMFLTMAVDKESWLSPALSICGRTIITIGFGIAYIYSAEIFPTILRSNGMSVGSMFARVGGIIAPFVGYIDELHPSLSAIVFGIVALMAAISVYFLPETMGHKLPETIDEVELRYERNNINKDAERDSGANVNEMQLPVK